MKKVVKFQINSHEWTVGFVGTGSKKFGAEEGETLLGFTNCITSEIFINSDITSQSVIFDTLIHELTHAYIFTCGFAQINKISEENVCDMFGAFGASLIKNANNIMKEWGYNND